MHSQAKGVCDARVMRLKFLMIKRCTLLLLQVPIRIAMVASRDIEPGEELLYNYGSFDSDSAKAFKGLVRCTCGTEKCLGSVF